MKKIFFWAILLFFGFSYKSQAMYSQSFISSTWTWEREVGRVIGEFLSSDKCSNIVKIRSDLNQHVIAGFVDRKWSDIESVVPEAFANLIKGYCDFWMKQVPKEVSEQYSAGRLRDFYLCRICNLILQRLHPRES